MEVHLLRDLLDGALKEADEKTRVGVFWCFAPDYDECILMFRKIFKNNDISTISSDECTVLKVREGFHIKDPYGGTDIFTFEEMRFLIDLWEKTFLQEVNEIYL